MRQRQGFYLSNYRYWLTIQNLNILHSQDTEIKLEKKEARGELAGMRFPRILNEKEIEKRQHRWVIFKKNWNEIIWCKQHLHTERRDRLNHQVFWSLNDFEHEDRDREIIILKLWGYTNCLYSTATVCPIRLCKVPREVSRQTRFNSAHNFGVSTPPGGENWH